MLFRKTNCSLIVLAPAKLNLFLRVVSRRPDGFHDLETVMTAINLYDTLMIEEPSSDSSPAQGSDDAGRLSLRVVDGCYRGRSGKMPFEAPADEKNLVIRAARLLRERTGCCRGASMTLIKRIPSSAGMGGGSSDCAAALAGLARFWNLRIPQCELMEMAAQLGSDIAFFLGTSSHSLCRGRGEIIEPLHNATPLHFVVAKPVSGLSTPSVFKKCQPDSTDGSVNRFVKPLHSGNLAGIARNMLNGLQAPAEDLNPEVRMLRELFERLPVLGHQMSGSGSSYFGVCHSQRQALNVAARLRSAEVPWVSVVASC